MKKTYAILAIIVAFILGLGIGYSACCCGKSKIAVVDLNAVAAKSQKFVELENFKAEEEAKLNEWLAESLKIVDAEKDKEKNAALLKQYREEYVAKRAIANQKFNQKAQEAKEDLVKVITEKAKEKGYKLVLAKKTTLYSSEDITQEIIEALK